MSMAWLPCDVFLPPATVIRRGCDISVLMAALRQREGRSFEDTSIPPEDQRALAATAVERQRCADIALAIDSGRGNEKQIAHAILNPSS